jgi:hypothetical protein
VAAASSKKLFELGQEGVRFLDGEEPGEGGLHVLGCL